MLQTASLNGFLRTILIILLVYYGLKILIRIFGSYILRYMSKKVQQRFGGQFQYQEEQQAQDYKQKDGETVIDKMPNTNKTSNKNVGEYIDYEEID